MKSRKKFWLGALTGALVMLLACGLLVYFLFGTSEVMNFRTSLKIQRVRKLIDDTFLYADDIDEGALQEALIKGYLQGLDDPYSEYYTQEEMDALLESLSGEIYGIGVLVAQDSKTGEITFDTVYEGSPAESAGFQDGDVLYRVAGEDIRGQDLDAVVSKIRGKIGTKIELTVFRGEKQEEYTAEVMRDAIELQTVSYEMREDGVGYIYVSGFEEVTYKQFENAIEDLQSQDVQALVIDLRNNPGGQLNTVCDMLDLLLPEGVIVSTKDRTGNGDVIKSDKEQLIAVPLCVLVNGASASASEVFAGAIQDYGIGTIVGTTTYGKGVVQQIFPMSDGSGIKLTVSEYFTPNGRNIHGIGIEPDVEVSYEYDEARPEHDNQLEKAIEIVKSKG